MPSLRLPPRTSKARAPWLGAFLLLLVLGAGVAWILMGRGYAVGYVRDVQPVAGTTKHLLELSPAGPGLQSFYVLAEAEPADALGHWMLARGEPLYLTPTEAVLQSSTVESLPFVHGGLLADAQRVLRDLGLVASAFGLGALVVGFVLLVTGFLALRLLSAALLGVLLGGIAWHVTVIGIAEGLFQAEAGVATTVFLGFGAVGAMLGLRRGGVLAEMAQRGALVFVLLALAPPLGQLFGWSLLAAQIVAVVVAVVSRPASLALLIAFLVAAGLKSTPLGSYVVLAGVALAIHLALSGRWLDLLGSLRARVGHAGSGIHLRLKDLVSA